ncbi:thioredoxin-like domain-containing protein [Maribacter algicola]|uniref:Thioredoxin-like domain-containing protein n=1 Tax=Meishania litoralis TaxID=3434685 RepID=A0ACC7LLN9_9FLAO
MKKPILVTAIALLLLACSQKPQGYTITGNLTGEVENGTQVFLRKMGENMVPVDVDTTTVENGMYVFSGEPVDAPEVHYVFIDKLLGYSPVILENSEVMVTAHKDSLGLPKLAGGPQNGFFADYMENSQAISSKVRSIQEDYQKAALAKDEATTVALNDEMNDLQDEAREFDVNFIKENPDALISVLLLERVIASRMFPMDEVQTLYDGLSENMRKTGTAKKVLDQLEEMKLMVEREKSTEIGAKAPLFSGPTPDGKELALADAMGKVTLVDFWAAWCKPCRAENPNVLKVYNKYHNKGLNIVGVSLDRKAEDWNKAIADDGLVWSQISNLAYFNDPIAKLYNVDAIPAAFLLDENGVIVGKNLRGAALEEKVAELLN